MTKKELFDIATDENRTLSERYEAARELQRRKIPPDKFTKFVRLYPKHTISELSKILNIPHETLKGAAEKYGLYRAVEGTA